MYELYDRLELIYPSTIFEIKQSYRKLAKKYHPDKYNKGDETFKQISQAYQILSNQRLKQIYDQQQKQLQYDMYIKIATNLFELSCTHFLLNLQ